ncbi:hypothetical protein C8F01DRAFT_753867 [Mycena amicta]|nr:hypothetical protein C8F01DRAFT_753867 [Mycena amicta]
MTMHERRAFDIALRLIFVVAGILGVLCSAVVLFSTSSSSVGLGPHEFTMALSLSRDGLLKATAVVLAGFWFLVAFAVRAFLRLRRAEANSNSGAATIPRDLESGGPIDNEKSTIPTIPPFSYPPPNDESYRCIDCPLSFTRAHQLADHLEDGHGWQQYPLPPLPAPYTCIDCSATFTLPNLLRQHIQSIHGWQQGPGPSFPVIPVEFACIDCPATFADKSQLRIHMEDTHSWFQDFIPSPPSPILSSMQMNANAMMKCTVNACGTLCPERKAYDDHKRWVRDYGMWTPGPWTAGSTLPAPVNASWSGYNGNNDGNNNTASAFPGFTASALAPTTAPYIYNPPFAGGSLPKPHSNSTASPWSSFANTTHLKPNPNTLYPSGPAASNTVPSPWPIYNPAQSPWSQPPSTHIPAPTSPFYPTSPLHTYSPPGTPPLGSHIPRVNVPTVPSIPMSQVPPRTCAYFNCGRTFSSEEALSVHLTTAPPPPHWLTCTPTGSSTPL